MPTGSGGTILTDPGRTDHRSLIDYLLACSEAEKLMSQGQV